MYVHTKVLIVFMLPSLGHIQENGEASYLGNFYDLLKKTITVLEMKKKSWVLFKYDNIIQCSALLSSAGINK